MTQTTHTPGPWEWVDGAPAIEARVDPENSQTYYAPICQLDLDWDGHVMAANAHLIAAAPDLLAALESAIEALIETRYYPSEIKRLRNAIAKAKGQ